MENYQIASANMTNNSHAFSNIIDVSNANGLLGMKVVTDVPYCSFATIVYEDGAFDGSESSVKSDKKEDQKKIKEQRYAFQTRSRVDILDDRYRWRKYGQKPVKKNKFPRSYYRCTKKGCNVKKQVQRLSKDEEIVVTTYQGKHNHHTHKCSSNNLGQILSAPTTT